MKLVAVFPTFVPAFYAHSTFEKKAREGFLGSFHIIWGQSNSKSNVAILES